MSTTQYLSDLRKALPRPFQHLVRDARRYHNDRKPLFLLDAWVEGAERYDTDAIVEREGLESVRAFYQTGARELGYALHEYRAGRYVEIPDEWYATTKAELYQLRAERRDRRATPGTRRWMDLRFMELMAGSAQQWFEGIRDCTILGDGARHAGTIEREVKEALGQGCLFKAAGVNPAPTAAEAEAERTEAAPEAPVELTTLVVPPVPASPRPSIITHADESWTAAPPADPLHQAA